MPLATLQGTMISADQTNCLLSSQLLRFTFFVTLAALLNESKSDAAPSSVQKIDGLNTAALILARGGSKGIRKKNLSIVNGRSLINRAVSNILAADVFPSVWVSTDDIEIGIEAQNSGAKIHWRDPMTATNEAPSILGVQDFYKKHPEIRVIGLVQCTSPFLIPEDLIEAHHSIQRAAYDSVFSVTRSHQLRWKYNERGELAAINFNSTDRPRRQDWDGELVENGMFYIFKTSLLARGLLQGGRSHAVEIPRNRSLEIDSETDLRIAREIAPLLDSLNQIWSH